MGKNEFSFPSYSMMRLSVSSNMVLPVLKSYDLPFGISVPTGHLGRQPTWVTF